MGWLLEERQFVRVRICNVRMRYMHKGDKKRESELQIGFIGFVLWLVHSCSKFMFACSLLILTYANNAQKCLDGTLTHTHNFGFSLQIEIVWIWISVDLFLFILGWFVCLLQHHSFPSASFFVTLGLPLSAATQLLKNASPTHFNYYFCFSRPKKLRRLKSYTNKLNWIYLSSGNESE